MISASRVMKVGAKDFFDMLIDSVLYDIKQSTGKKISRNNFRKGTSYRKKIKSDSKFSRPILVKVAVTQFDPPHLYEATFSGEKESSIIRYEVEELGEDKIKVTYKEQPQGGNPGGWMARKMAQRNLKSSLAHMEKAVIEHKAELEEKKKLDEKTVEE